MKPFHLLVTGSRAWTDRDAVYAELDTVLAEHPGAREAGITIERYPADWIGCGRAASPLRNQRMVDAGADLCLAFWSGEIPSGTHDCLRRAVKAGIPVRIVPKGKGQS